MPRKQAYSLTRREVLRTLAAASASAVVGGSACTPRAPDDGRLHLAYWEKWERFEGEAMEAVVRDFNASQNEIVVHYVPTSLADRKVLTATAGGDPPDLAGLWDNNVASFADRGVFTPLDGYMKRDGITRDHWIRAYADICTHRGRMWAIPTTPGTYALHWNKSLFRQAGLDPDTPPRSQPELDEYARLLTLYDKDKNLTQLGFLPQEPGWCHWAWPNWFGGQLIDEDKNITADHPLNVDAFEWVRSYYTTRFDGDKVGRFTGGFGNFASPQNPFFSGKIAMIIQGVWMDNYIKQYAPGMEYGVSPWPATPTGPDRYSVAQCDILTIPAGLPRHREEAAWEFVKFALSRPAMEKLNLGQGKNTPIREVSEDFLARHSNPYIERFIEMSKFEQIMKPLQIGVWQQYMSEIFFVFERMRVRDTNPDTGRPYTAAEALAVCQRRMERAWNQHRRSLEFRESATEGGA